MFVLFMHLHINLPITCVVHLLLYISYTRNYYFTLENKLKNLNKKIDVLNQSPFGIV